MTVLFKRLTVFRFLTVPPSAVHGLPSYDGIPPSTGTDVQHGKITSGIFPRTTLLIFKDVSREFDEFQVNTHLCKLRCLYVPLFIRTVFPSLLFE